MIEQTRAPRLGAIAWRHALVCLVAGLATAIGLAFAGVAAVGEGGDLFVSLLPAVLTIGPAMAVPPFLLGLLGVAVVQRPPRTARSEILGMAIGAVVGALVSPVLFYAGSVLLGLLVAGIVAAITVPGGAVIVARLWRRVT